MIRGVVSGAVLHTHPHALLPLPTGTIHHRLAEDAVVQQLVKRLVELSWQHPGNAPVPGAANESEKSLYKLLNNSTFGKTMENVRAYRSVRFAVDGRELGCRVTHSDVHVHGTYSSQTQHCACSSFPASVPIPAPSPCADGDADSPW